MKEWFENDEKWYPSEYGQDDVLGTLNHINKDKVKSAIGLVKSGRIINLSHEIYNGMPGRQAIHGPFFYLLSQRVYDHRPPFRKPTRNKFGAALSRMEMVDHLGTHIDSLNHISFDNKFYNGNDAYDLSAVFGTTKLGIDETPPIVTRGIMVDSTEGREIMEHDEPVKLKQVQKYLSERDINVQPGDAIFFYTGTGRLWHEPQKYNEYYERSPGIGMELAKWLAEKKVGVTGSDTPSTEVSPPEIEGTRLPVHQYLITKQGIRLIDNINLNELAAEKISEFLFVLSPMRIKGSTASPATPIAIV